MSDGIVNRVVLADEVTGNMTTCPLYLNICIVYDSARQGAVGGNWVGARDTEGKSGYYLCGDSADLEFNAAATVVPQRGVEHEMYIPCKREAIWEVPSWHRCGLIARQWNVVGVLGVNVKVLLTPFRDQEGDENLGKQFQIIDT